MDTDTDTAAADLEAVRTRAARRRRLVIQDLVRAAGARHLRGVELEDTIIDRQGIRIGNIRLGVDIAQTGRSVAAITIVTDEILAVVELQIVIVPALLHGELVGGESAVVVDDDTILGRDTHIRTVR